VLWGYSSSDFPSPKSPELFLSLVSLQSLLDLPEYGAEKLGQGMLLR
jgi:hypothetical protein